MKYREATISDFAQLKELGKISYSEFSEVLDGEHWEKMYIFLDDEQVLKKLIFDSKVFVCELSSKLIGMVYFVPSGSAYGKYEAEWSRIRYLGVNPEYRGRSIGKELTQLCIEEAKVRGEKFVALHTSEFMNTARKMYENLGFKQLSYFQHYGKKYWIYLLSIH